LHPQLSCGLLFGLCGHLLALQLLLGADRRKRFRALCTCGKTFFTVELSVSDLDKLIAEKQGISR
jgi:hypothetical protein